MHGTTKATRHMQHTYLFLQDLVTSGAIHILKIAGTDNPTDILTKFVKVETLQRLLHKVGVQQVPHCIANLYIGSKYNDQKKIELANYQINQNTTNTNTTHTKKKSTTIDTTNNTYVIGSITNNDYTDFAAAEVPLKSALHLAPIHTSPTIATASNAEIFTGAIGATTPDATTVVAPELLQATTDPSSTTPSTGDATNAMVGVHAIKLGTTLETISNMMIHPYQYTPYSKTVHTVFSAASNTATITSY